MLYNCLLHILILVCVMIMILDWQSRSFILPF